MRIQKELQFKSKLQNTKTESASVWPPRRLCYRLAIFFLDLHLIAFSFPQK